MSADAKVTVSAEGTEAAARKLKDVGRELESLGKAVGSIVAGAVRDFGAMATSLAQIDPVGAANKFRAYREEIARMGATSGRSIEDLKRGFSDLQGKTLLPDERIAKFGAALAKTTHDFGDSRKAIEALSAHGLVAGKSLEEMGPIAETLHNTMGVAFSDMPGMLDAIAGAAESLGVTGGPAALQDELVGLGSTLNQISITGKKDALELVGVLAAVGKGLPADRQKALQQQLVSHFARGGEQMRLNLGINRKDFYDENGQIKINAQNVQRLRDFYIKRTGSEEGAFKLAAFSNNLGPQLAAALFRPGLIEDMRKAQDAKPSDKAEAAQDRLRNSQTGKEIGAQLKRESDVREKVGGSLNSIQQGAAGLMPTSLGGFMAMQVGSSVLSLGLNKGMETAFGALGKAFAPRVIAAGEAAGKFGGQLSGAMGPVSGFVGALGKAALVAAAFEGGYKVGEYLDKKYQLSDRAAQALAGLTGAADEDKATEDVGAAAHHNMLVKKESDRQDAIAALVSQGMTRGQAIYQVDHPSEAGKGGAKPTAPAEVHVKITDDSSHPNRVVAVQKSKAGAQ